MFSSNAFGRQCFGCFVPLSFDALSMQFLAPFRNTVSTQMDFERAIDSERKKSVENLCLTALDKSPPPTSFSKSRLRSAIDMS